MSDISLREEGLLVADQALAPEVFSSVCREAAAGDYRWVHSQKWDKAWRTWDGQVLRGESVYFDPENRFNWKGLNYPTLRSMDVLIDTIRHLAAEFPEIAGREGVDWNALYLSPWLYPVGSALSLHCDGADYSGAFTFFVHSHWSVHWGGELLVSRGGNPASEPASSQQVVEPWMAADAAAADGADISTSISPAPNRLVLIGPDRPHRVARVDQNAGARVRASIAGFFLRA